LDWFGVTVLIFGSNMMISFFEITNRAAYVMYNILNGCMAAYTYAMQISSLREGGRGAGAGAASIENYAYRIVKSSIFSFSIVALHLYSSLFSVMKQEKRELILLAYVSYILPTLMQIFNIPEGLFPGWFDIIGSSHQIMHIGIIAGFYFIWKIYYEVVSNV
jgi:predicted membrane channel-forming protein YqfA (hemolysin III family)